MKPTNLDSLKDSRSHRVKNEHLFAEANRNIYVMAQPVLEQAGISDYPLAFICECADANCRETISLSGAQFEQSHERANHFFIKPHHVYADIEQVRKRFDTHWIVKKTFAVQS